MGVDEDVAAGAAIGDPWSAEVVAKVAPPSEAELAKLRPGTILVGFLTLSEEFFAPVWLIAGLATALYSERTCVSST